MSAFYALSAFLMTLAGGAFAFKYQKYLLYIMAFSAGLLIGVAFLDLMPEIFDLAHRLDLDVRQLMVMTVCGFVAIFLLEKLTIIHSEKQHDAPGHHHHVGLAGAIGLSFHSFLDGLAIGVGFQAGTKVGVIVLLAVGPRLRRRPEHRDLDAGHEEQHLADGLAARRRCGGAGLRRGADQRRAPRRVT